MRKFVSIAALIMLAGSAGACAKMLGLERDKEDGAFEHRAHVLEGINCNDFRSASFSASLSANAARS